MAQAVSAQNRSRVAWVVAAFALFLLLASLTGPSAGYAVMRGLLMWAWSVLLGVALVVVWVWALARP